MHSYVPRFKFSSFFLNYFVFNIFLLFFYEKMNENKENPPNDQPVIFIVHILIWIVPAYVYLSKVLHASEVIISHCCRYS